MEEPGVRTQFILSGELARAFAHLTTKQSQTRASAIRVLYARKL